MPMHYLATPKGVMAKLKNYTHFNSQESQQESVQMAPKYPGRRLLKIGFSVGVPPGIALALSLPPGSYQKEAQALPSYSCLCA